MSGTYANTARVAGAAADPDVVDNVSTAAGPAQANVIIASQPPAPPQAELVPPKADDLPATGAAVLGVLARPPRSRSPDCCYSASVAASRITPSPLPEVTSLGHCVRPEPARLPALISSRAVRAPAQGPPL